MKKTNPEILEGKIVNAFGNQITWICSEGNERNHTLVEGAKILLDGKPGKLDNLKVGMPVSVTVCDEDDSKTSCIAARRKKVIPYT